MYVKMELCVTHWGRVTHICVGDYWLKNDLPPGRRQAIIWTNAEIVVIWNIKNKLQWNFNRNSHIFIQENTFETVVCGMAAILSRPHCVKKLAFS